MKATKKPSPYKAVSVKIEAVIVSGPARESWAGKQLWINRDGIAFDAYAADSMRNNPKLFNETTHKWKNKKTEAMYNVYSCLCSGHYAWAQFFEGKSTEQLENLGWCHVSYGRIMARKSKLTKQQKDTLCIWGLFNGCRGQEDAWLNVFDDIEQNNWRIFTDIEEPAYA